MEGLRAAPLRHPGRDGSEKCQPASGMMFSVWGLGFWDLGLRFGV